MPLYDFQCRQCMSVKETRIPLSMFREEIVAPCEICRQDTIQDLVIRPTAVDDWGHDGQGRWIEHLGPQGKYFPDRRSYKQHLRDHGLVEL